MAPSADTGHRLSIAAGEDDAGRRLDRLLAESGHDLSRSRLQALIAAGHVSCGGRTIDDAAYRVKPGQIFDIVVPAPVPARPEAQAMDLTIVHEDDALLVIDKPAGLVVHPAAGNPDRTLVNALLAHCREGLSGIGGVARPGIVHRLDKDTSGLMVVAKTDVAHVALTRQFADRSLSRTYRAFVHGVPNPVSGTIDAPIGRSPRNRKKMAVVRGGKAAQTHYRTLKTFGSAASLVECTLGTGRTHQIRVHLAHLGNPVIGDTVYGGTRRGSGPLKIPFPRQALHAARLKFQHPTADREVVFKSDFPTDMQGLLHFLERRDLAIPD